MATISSVQAGQQIMATDVNAHITQTNTNTSNITTNSSNITTNTSDISSINGQLSRSNGQQEHGSYLLSQGCGGASWFVSLWLNTLSKGNAPGSVSLDQSIGGATNCNNPTTAHLNQYGFQVNTTSTGATNNATVGGNWTANF
jgi:hypothetical protein